MAEIVDRGRKITLCHYPLLVWNRCGKGAYHIYGHVHNQMERGYGPVLAAMTDAFNACVDVNGFEPVSFEELVENNTGIKQLNI